MVSPNSASIADMTCGLVVAVGVRDPAGLQADNWDWEDRAGHCREAAGTVFCPPCVHCPASADGLLWGWEGGGGVGTRPVQNERTNYTGVGKVASEKQWTVAVISWRTFLVHQPALLSAPH